MFRDLYLQTKYAYAIMGILEFLELYVRQDDLFRFRLHAAHEFKFQT